MQKVYIGNYWKIYKAAFPQNSYNLIEPKLYGNYRSVVSRISIIKLIGNQKAMTMILWQYDCHLANHM